MDRLVYQPLDSSKSEIRLLSIVPDPLDGPVRCTLHVVSLDCTPVFRALSYVWGDASITEDITIESCKLAVTTNLEAALRAVRRCHRNDGTEMPLWADAVCIEQANLAERSSQVKLMYRNFRLGITRILLDKSRSRRGSISGNR